MAPKIVSREEWLAARKDLFEKEKASAQAAEVVSSTIRTDFPMVKLDKDYAFDGPKGKASLADLFEGRKQLILYHFMMSPDDEAGCAGCSFFADNLPSSAAHLNHEDTTLVLVSRAPLANIEKYKKRMGWNFPWYSSFNSDFNYDFQATLDDAVTSPIYHHKRAGGKGEHPGLSMFFKEAGEIFLTYTACEGGIERLLLTYSLLDLTPSGRGDIEKVQRRDEYVEVK